MTKSEARAIQLPAPLQGIRKTNIARECLQFVMRLVDVFAYVKSKYQRVWDERYLR